MALGLGFSLHADTAAHGNDREGLARLCRYASRGPVAEERLERLPDGRYQYATKKGAVLVLTAEALVKRLVALVPPARLHLTSSHGVYAANARLRPVVLQPEPEPATPPLKEDAPQKAKPTRPPRLDWATLQAKTFGTDVWKCPRCGGHRRVVGLVTSRQTAEDLLAKLGLLTPRRLLPPDCVNPEVQLRWAGLWGRDEPVELVGVVGVGRVGLQLPAGTRQAGRRLRKVTTPWWVNDFTYVSTTGQVESLTRGAQRLEWQYDGFLVTEEKASGIAPATSQWSYDSDFRRASHTVGGVPISFGYDNDSLLTRAGAERLTWTPDAGRLSAITLGSVSISIAPNEYGELSTLAAWASGTALYSEGLSYDAAGRIRVVEEVIQGTPVQWVYGYDRLGQLTSASRNGAMPTTWTYDGAGNRLTEDAVSSTFDAQDRLKTKGITTYEWDALGGRQRKSEGSAVTQYNHDGLGALSSVTLPDSTVVTYEYDGRQRRVAKRRNGTVVTRWVYDGQYRVAAEVDGAGVLTSRFVYASTSNSPDYLVRGGVTYAYVKNHLGSVRLVVDSSTGAVAQRLDYDAWGNITSNSAPDFQPFAFAGGVYDIDTKLTHFGFREYDAQAGVWTAKDPIRLGVGAYLSPEPMLQSPAYVRLMAQTGMSVPTYGYALNNPLRYVDINGLFPLPANPSGLPAGWVQIPHGPAGTGGPSGETRWQHPSGRILDFHPGQEGNEDGEDHWHWRDEKGKKKTGFRGDTYEDPPEECAPEGPKPDADDNLQRTLLELVHFLHGGGVVPIPGPGIVPVFVVP